MTRARQAIALHSVSKTYPGVRALLDVSLSLGPGEVVGLVGKNGAGKSTLINIIAGAVHPDDGTVTIGDEAVRMAGPRESRRRGIAIVPQEIQLNEELSVAENISLGGGRPKRAGVFLNRRALVARAQEVLGRLDATIDPRRTVRSLTTAERRLVMIARALWDQGRVQVLVLDEPTESLTKREADRLHQLIDELRAEGLAIIYVSHRLRDVMEVATRVVVMRDGAIVEDRPRDQIDHDELFALISGAAILTEPATDHVLHEAGAELLRAAVPAEGLGMPQEITLRAGEILGVAGLVGSGRTEFLRAVYGADPVDGVLVSTAGGQPSRPTPAWSVRSGIGLLPEERRSEGLFGVLSVTDNVAIASMRRLRYRPKLPVVSKRRATRETKRWIDRLGIVTPRAETPVRRLSGGNQQKVLFARSLAAGCRVLLLDEPTNGVDVGAKREIHDTIRGVAESGGGAIVVASDFSELCDLASRIVVMRNGRLVGELVGGNVNEDAILRLCYAVSPAA